MLYTGRNLQRRRRLALAALVAGAAVTASVTPAHAQSNFAALSSGVTNTIAQATGYANGVALPANGTLTSGFGARWGTNHNGIDIANAVGTPIYAVMDGTVISSGPASGYGQWIRIQHDDGSISIYGHMEYLYVSVGERVSAGQEIAGMGSRGFSTGSHLHFEIHPDGVTPVDPQTWLANHGIYV
ncbi:metalloendopeptidase-like protein [Corynebacterium deserti GIMN1.010]|uniref:Metalloendopeptidase-like protein n=1 Tax=Corynebacterium deserti GIMN1.010 TaxID=931089 RepID=A0A0M4CR98_9CORY|nr:M23 family metallopeptidase [Corynebacterium deserti]ALC06630.1 metalloendopeptidase-like protein [Corynebacterium deserti GIMN1.010]